jgi:ribosomal protein S18 acetylase RimI-like enzyme
MTIDYKIDDKNLTAEVFLDFVQKVWPGDYNKQYTQEALLRTINITAWNKDQLVGSIRVLTDGYFFGTIPEILVDPNYQKQGIGKKLMELAWENSPTSLFFGARPGNEDFFVKAGFEKGMQSFAKKKQRKS